MYMGDTQAIAPGIDLGRRHVVVKATEIIPGEEDGGALP